ncbi:ribonuclease h protein [Artemisia annua]|uniref:Ribonuclease h protein n=1 Tax=Artemisia annua TaxID=35608 RepID=A0A2U1LPM3_ARTAN|nr:ribonuclease h protein [Artemisia annua]
MLHNQFIFDHKDNKMVFVFMPMFAMAPMVPPYHPHQHLLHQQEYLFMMKSRWMFPGDNILKLNTDGSSIGSPGPSSFGGLIRDSKGTWVCGYMGNITTRWCTSLEAEIWSVYRGLCLISDKNLSNVLIETDCQAVLMLGLEVLDTRHPWKSVMDAINMIMRDQKCTMVHTRRDGNYCADLLAKLGSTQFEEYIKLEEPPILLKQYLLQDIEAAFEFQKNNHFFTENINNGQC